MAGEKVLIGESDKKVQKQLRRYLEERGYVVYAYSEIGRAHV